MNKESFYGVHTALVTPFQNREVSRSDIETLVEAQVIAGVSGFVAVGTTGESPTLSTSEHIDFIKLVSEFADKRVPVIAGTGSNSTREAVSLAIEADKAGADAMLVVAPYYNKPSQEGLYHHFCAIAEATEKPIILYSIPSRCGIAIDVPTVARLYEAHPHIMGIKEAGGSCDRVSQLYKELGPDYVILSGDDSLTLPFMTCGAKGVVSVASNADPAGVVKMVKLALEGNYHEAIALNQKYYSLFKNLFVEPNPVPVKYAMKKLGLLSAADVRRPLCEMTDKNKALIDKTLLELGLISE